VPPIRDLPSIPKETKSSISCQPKTWKLQKPPNFAPNRTTSLIKYELKQEQGTTEPEYKNCFPSLLKATEAFAVRCFKTKLPLVEN